MKKPRQSLLIIAFLLFMAISANAQEKGQKGLVIAYPNSVGFIWNVTDRVAIRPDVSFAKAMSGTTPSPSFDTNSIEAGFSALFYVKKWENVAAYVTPRFPYSRSKITNGALTAGSAVSWSYPASASFGVQYSFNQRFSVFGEAGIEYIRAHTNSPFSVFPLTKTWRSKSGIGIDFYF